MVVEGELMALLEVGAVPADVTDGMVEVAGLAVRVLRKGQGRPLVFLHDSLGNVGWIPLYERLAVSYDVVVPDLPGYGASERPQWARSPRDLAILTLQLLDRLEVRDVTLVGVGFGGFLAAEMATMSRSLLRRLVLIGPVGIKPRHGEIADQILRGCVRFGAAGFRDPESFRALFDAEKVPDDLYRLWDLSNEMTARVCWKPAMFSLEMHHLLSEVRVPTLVVFGAEDRLVPLDVGEQYVERLPDARLVVVADAGHWVDLEQPDVLNQLISELDAQGEP
jgi:pimeloyl-ACP methyl ester carboxylesterase